MLGMQTMQRVVSADDETATLHSIYTLHMDRVSYLGF